MHFRRYLASACLLCSSIVIGPVAFAAPTVWSIASGGNGHAYEVVNSNVYWIAARADAASRAYLGASGYLATITSPAEQNFIISTFFNPNAAYDSTPAYWLGATDDHALYPTASEGNWKWITGEPFVFGAPTGSPPYDSAADFPHPPWHIDNPSNSPKTYGPENVLWLFTGLAGVGLPESPRWTWNDAQAFEQSEPYIVEYTLPVPEPSGMMLGTLAAVSVGCIARAAAVAALCVASVNPSCGTDPVTLAPRPRFPSRSDKRSMRCAAAKSMRDARISPLAAGFVRPTELVEVRALTRATSKPPLAAAIPRRIPHVSRGISLKSLGGGGLS